MSSFPIHKAASLAEALARLAKWAEIPAAGCTDLFATARLGPTRPQGAVDVSGVPELLGIVRDANGNVRIGAAVPLMDLANDGTLREQFGALATACASALSNSRSEHATIGGSLAQRPTCAYFRTGVACHKNGGDGCPAVTGNNRALAILEGGPCWAPHPSDAAVALVALDAIVEVDGPNGTRTVPAFEFFVLPSRRLDREIALRDSELIVAVWLPTAAAGGLQYFEKVTHTEESSYAVVSIAAIRRTGGEARLVLGGVSPRPYRVYTSVEEEAISGGLDADSIAGLAERALLDARPLTQNSYKLELAAGLLRRGIRVIAAD